MPVLGIAGCSNDGAVHLQIELPADSRLSPVSANLARLTLVTEIDGAEGQTTSRDVPSTALGTSISFGDVPIHGDVHLSLLGFAASGRLVGFGRASAPIEVTAGADVAVAIPLRRPFAYVAGGPELIACDTTVEGPFTSVLDAAPGPTAVAATSDGSQVVSAGGQLLRLSTATHAATAAAPVALAAGASRVAVSPDSRWAVIVHAGTGAATRGISVVDLAGAGAVTPTFVPIDRPAAVAVGTDTAYVLSGPTDCTAQSMIVPVRLGATVQAGAAFGLAGAARDVALAADGHTLLVAEPCPGVDAVVGVTGDGATQIKIVNVPSPTNVAVLGSRVWAVGRDTAGGAHLVLASANLDKSAPARIDLDPTQELVKSNDLTESGQVTEVRLDAALVDAYSLSVLPDGRSVALLVHATYHADAIVRPVDFGGVIFDETIVPTMDMETYEYQLIDVPTRAATQRLRTSCNITWDRGTAVLDDWACASALGQDTTDSDFVASQVTVLYGAR